MIYIIRLITIIVAALNIKWCIKAYKNEMYFFCGIFVVFAVYFIYGLCVPLSVSQFIGG